MEESIEESVEKSVEWTDEQLMLLEQITYISDWYNPKDGEPVIRNIEDMVNLFDEKTLAELDAMTGESPGEGMTATGAEWAAIIRAIQDDEKLMQLKLQESDTEAETYCFTYPGNEDEAIVVFRGTVDGDEWYDNVEGLNTADTECQIEALDFVESLPYDNIIAVGHSKGGNKAQYVTILSDKVTKCLAMDAQGFSQEFFDKYSAEIAERGNLITNHSLANDYVHILMFPIPGSTQIYYEGMKENYGFPQNHYASNFFVYTENDEGELELKLSKVVDEEAQFVTYLREFTYFIINEMPASEKPETIEYVGTLLALMMCNDEEFTISYQDVTYQKNQLVAMAVSNPDALATVLAYFFKYTDTYNITGSDITSLIGDFLGADILLNVCVPFQSLTGLPFYVPAKYLADPLAWFLDFLGDRVLNDEKDYEVLQALNYFIGMSFYNGVDLDVAALWDKIQSEYKRIGDVKSWKANDCGEIIDDYTKDFSQATYTLLVGTIDSGENIRYFGTSGWGNYASESWYDTLPVEQTRNTINLYFSKLSETQAVCKEKINTIFEEVISIDEAKALRMQDVDSSLCSISSSILSVAEGIG